jgi:hypothetical protein
MRKRFVTSIAPALAVLLLAVPSAAAFEEVGNPCVASDSEANWTLLEDSYSSEAAPEISSYVNKPGVITRWQVRVAPTLAPLAQKLVVHETLGQNKARKLAESAVEIVSPGWNEFATRIPVSEVNKVGLSGPVETFFCGQQKGVLGGAIAGDFPVGEIHSYELEYEVGAPVTAIVEPDIDGDLYGDETQDACPWTAAYQSDCPTEKLEIVSTAVRQRAILVEVRVAYDAALEVFGQVSWQVRRPRHDTAAQSRKGARRLAAVLSAGRDRTIRPANPAVFRLPLPKSVQRQLGLLAPRQSLRAKLTVRATDAINGVIERKLTVKLPGRER